MFSLPIYSSATLTNMLILMFIAFCIDQIQQATSKYFAEALNYMKSKKALWIKLYALFSSYIVKCWKTLYLALANKYTKPYLGDLVDTR